MVGQSKLSHHCPILYHLEVILLQFDNMSEPRHRKLTAMGIASLVSTGRLEVLQRLPTEIFNLWLDVFGEIKEARVDAVANEAGRLVNLALIYGIYTYITL
jgi:hypothetical protein